MWSRELAFQSRKGEGSVSLSVAENFTRSCQPVIQRLGVEHYRSSTPLNLTLVLALSQTHTHTSTHFLTGTQNITALYTESTLQRFVRVDFSSACHGVRPAPFEAMRFVLNKPNSTDTEAYTGLSHSYQDNKSKYNQAEEQREDGHGLVYVSERQQCEITLLSQVRREETGPGL